MMDNKFQNTYRITEINGAPVFIAVSPEQYERLNEGEVNVGDKFPYTASGGEAGRIVITDKKPGPWYKAVRC